MITAIGGSVGEEGVVMETWLAVAMETKTRRDRDGGIEKGWTGCDSQ